MMLKVRQSWEKCRDAVETWWRRAKLVAALKLNAGSLRLRRGSGGGRRGSAVAVGVNHTGRHHPLGAVRRSDGGHSRSRRGPDRSAVGLALRRAVRLSLRGAGGRAVGARSHCLASSVAVSISVSIAVSVAIRGLASRTGIAVALALRGGGWSRVTVGLALGSCLRGLFVSITVLCKLVHDQLSISEGFD